MYVPVMGSGAFSGWQEGAVKNIGPPTVTRTLGAPHRQSAPMRQTGPQHLQVHTTVVAGGATSAASSASAEAAQHPFAGFAAVIGPAFGAVTTSAPRDPTAMANSKAPLRTMMARNRMAAVRRTGL